MIAAMVLCAGSCVKKDPGFPDRNPQDRTLFSSMTVRFPDDRAFEKESAIDAWKLVGSGKCYSFISSEGGSPAEFTLCEEIQGVNQIAYLTYPGGIVDSLYRGEFFLSIPSEQTAVENGCESDLWIAAGHKAKETTTLTPVVGMLKFTIAQADIASCTIASKSGNAVSGPVMVKMDEAISVSKQSKPKAAVTVNGAMAMGHSYAAVAMADEYTVLDITLRNSFGVLVWEKSIDVFDKLDKGGVLDLGNFGNPDLSSLAISMTTTEYAGCTVKTVAGYSENEHKLFNAEVDEIFESGKTLTARAFGLESADYSASKIWIVLTMEDPQGGIISLPMKIDGFKIEKASEVKCDLGEISVSRNDAPWFYPYADKRLKPGAGYAYGEANTFLIQCKQSSYTGTVISNPDIPESVTIDYRLRGTPFGGPKPDNVSFEWMMGYNNSTPAWDKYTMDRTNIYNCGKYSFAVDTDNYTVTVTNTGAHAGSPILLMKKDGRIIWAWTFWNIAADGTTLEAIDFGGVQLANMDIGYCSNQIASITPKIKFIRSSCNYYQWGRPMPVFSAQGAGISLGENDARNNDKPRVYVADCGPCTVETALSNPGKLIQRPFTKGVASKELADWTMEGLDANQDLWGGSDKNSDGAKTIYDPCPKGWRVPDAKTFLNVFPQPVKGYSLSDYPQETTAGYQGVYVRNVLFVTNGVLKSSTDKDGYVEQIAFTPKSNATAKDASRFWTNTYCGSENAGKCYVFKADYQYTKLDATENPDRTIGVDNSPAGTALPVRCQKDNDNR